MRINCHCHVFSLDCVPSELRERYLLNLKDPVNGFFYWLVRTLLPGDSKPAQWLGFADKPISEIAQELVKEMDEAGVEICTPLMMDMERCPIGGDLKAFEDQLAETAAAAGAINRQYGRPRLLPFIAADPRRPNVAEIVKTALNSGVFKGVKIYPVMGFEPNDRRLYPIYQLCVDNTIPITAHCENGGIPGLENHWHLANPTGWGPVLEKYNALTLNLAHNDKTGSDWQETIRQLIEDYPNVYTDVSYDLEMWFSPRAYFKKIQEWLGSKKIKDRVLYGTDWYLGRYCWTEVSYLKWYSEYARRIPWCRVRFSDEELKRLTEDNPKRFLGL